ncbi:MAG: ribosome maturation factor RimP [Deltaproteobacteria bacterium]|jgi:ribosome maturation factor RimP|nr:ribosome maturation factor RimP [Deltaproteobacteria bacterium]MBT4524956.1 ribosome maturation factor RimP [Deltaproteobacteria bacterium]
MTLSEATLNRLIETLDPILTALNYELVDIRIRKENDQNVLDVKIDKVDGITIDDCAIASRKISLVLDIEDIINFSYTLQVGSPGIFRELKKEKDFVRNMNNRIKVHHYTSKKQNKKTIGILTAYEDNAIIINTDQGNMTLNFDDIKKIQLFPDI